MKVAIGADHFGLPLKITICQYLEENDIEFYDFSTSIRQPVDYPDIADAVSEAIKNGEMDQGILICGTGLGMAIAANKVKGIRAATCHDIYSAERAKKSNNANIITLGSQVIGPELAKILVGTWLFSEFQAGRSTRKVKKILSIEERNFR